MGPLGEFGALFNPGMRHENEEKLAKQMLREDEGTGRKGRLGIDLESGVVVIETDDDARPDQGDDADDSAAAVADSADSAPTVDGAATADAGDDPAPADEGSEPSSSTNGHGRTHRTTEMTAAPRSRPTGGSPVGKARRRR